MTTVRAFEVVSALAAFALAACDPASQLLPRNQPPDVVDKLALVPNAWLSAFEASISNTPPPPSDGVDEPWFQMTTTIVSQSGAGDLVTNLRANGRRFRWDATRNYLIGRDVNGVLIAAFAIESHFDVRHDNVTAPDPVCSTFECPDTSLPPWPARRFMRVGWEQNVLTLIDTLDSPSAAVTNIDPVPTFVTSPSDPNAMRIYCGTELCDPPTITASTTSFSIVNRAIAHVTRPDGAQAPPIEVTLRYTFSRE